MGVLMQRGVRRLAAILRWLAKVPLPKLSHKLAQLRVRVSAVAARVGRDFRTGGATCHSLARSFCRHLQAPCVLVLSRCPDGR